MTLLEEVKQKLRVTWNDEDSRIEGIIERGQAYLNRKCNTDFNYSLNSDHKTLLLERCFYDYNNALGDFEKNYRSELQAIILSCAVEKRR